MPPEEEQSMPEELEKIVSAEVSTRRQYAEKLHNKIKNDADMVASYLVDLCKDLKRMRDEQLYTELGYDTFDDYIEKDVGIKKRQVYTYISTYERLGDTLLQSNAQLGITKLSLLTEVPAADRPDFAEDNDLENKSTREIKELIEKSKQQGEQLSLLTSERDKAKEDADKAAEEAVLAQAEKDTLKEERAETARQLADAQAKIAELKKAEPDAAALEKLKEEARAAAEKEAKKQYADKLKAEKDKAKQAALSEAEEKIKAAREEGEKAAEIRIKESLAAAEKEKAAALARLAALEKQLKVSGNKEMAQFAYLYDETQQNFTKLVDLVKKIAGDDPDNAAKLRGAVQAMADKQAQDAKLI
jgi:hypothetical protein